MSTFYVTKNLFTCGIQPVYDCEIYVTGGREYVTRGTSAQAVRIFAHLGTEAFKTHEEAKRHAIEMCEKKLKTIDKQRIKVAKLLDLIRF